LSAAAELLPAAVSLETAQEDAAGAEDASTQTSTSAPTLHPEPFRQTDVGPQLLSLDRRGIGRSSGRRQ